MSRRCLQATCGDAGGCWWPGVFNYFFGAGRCFSPGLSFASGLFTCAYECFTKSWRIISCSKQLSTHHKSSRSWENVSVFFFRNAALIGLVVRWSSSNRDVSYVQRIFRTSSDTHQHTEEECCEDGEITLSILLIRLMIQVCQTLWPRSQLQARLTNQNSYWILIWYCNVVLKSKKKILIVVLVLLSKCLISYHL